MGVTCSCAWAALTGTYQGLEARPMSPVMGVFRTRSWPLSLFGKPLGEVDVQDGGPYQVGHLLLRFAVPVVEAVDVQEPCPDVYCPCRFSNHGSAALNRKSARLVCPANWGSSPSRTRTRVSVARFVAPHAFSAAFRIFPWSSISMASS